MAKLWTGDFQRVDSVARKKRVQAADPETVFDGRLERFTKGDVGDEAIRDEEKFVMGVGWRSR